MCWVVFEVTVGSSNFPRRFHPKVSKGLSGFNEIDDGLPEVSVEKPDDLVEVDVGDLGLPRVEDYLPRVDVGDVDPLPVDVEGYEPSEAGDPEGESPDPAAGVGDDEMEVDASLLEPTFEHLEALPTCCCRTLCRQSTLQG